MPSRTSKYDLQLLVRSLHPLIMDINVMVIWGFSDLLELFIFPGNHDYKAHIFIDFKKTRTECTSLKLCWIVSHPHGVKSAAESSTMPFNLTGSI